MNIIFNEVVFIGDDINDFELLICVGLSVVLSNVLEYIKSKVYWVLNIKGGDGVFRVFVEKLVEKYSSIDILFKKY